MKKILSISGFIVMIALFTAFALVSYTGKPKTYSTIEQRELAQFPKLDAKFTTNLNTYSNDQFYFRNQLMELKGNLQYLLGQRQMKQVWIGKDGMLFQQGKSLNSTHKYELANAINQFSNKTKLKAKMILIADRINLLPDLLEDYMITCDSLLDIQNLLVELNNIDYLDVNQVLMNQKDDFYYSDHHYTTKGAKLCFDEYFNRYLLKEVKYEYEIYPYTNVFQGTLANQSGYRNCYDQVSLYIEKDCDIKYVMNIDDKETSSIYSLEGKNDYEVFFNGNHPLVRIDTTASNDRHLLVIKDSFANAFVPFLIPYYQKITMIDPRYYYDDLYAYIKEYEVNDVLFLYSTQTLFSDTSLIDLLNQE